jgi:DNA repair protein RecO
MAYRTYTTRAIVLDAYERTGSDKTLRLFTEDAGMLYARAIGVRDEKSKMRYALQPFGVVRVSLIRGKQEWRISGAEPVENLFFSATNRSARAHLLECTKLVTRFVHGEEPHPALFRMLLEGLSTLKDTPSTDALLACRLRILYELGYVSPGDTLLGVCTESTLLAATTLLSDLRAQSKARTFVDAAFSASHL